jgi:RNA-directed DNA polymerase
MQCCVRDAIADRMAHVGLQPHPTKTRIVYGKDGTRTGSYPNTSFTFLGLTFQARAARSTAGVKFTSFLPAISKQAMKKLSGEVRRWRLHLKVPLTTDPIVRGWIQYYGAFYRCALVPLARINSYLVRWIRKKHKRLRSYPKAMAAWQPVTSQYPRLFFH